MREYSIVGKSLPRVDAKEKLTGAAEYTGDLRLPGMLFGKILRSHLPHAIIKNVNVERAKGLKGVEAIITGMDSTGDKYGMFTPPSPVFADRDPLARDKVRFIGDGVVAVAAVDEDLADEALDLIEVDYEELPAVFNPEEAMAEGAPKIHDYAERNVNVRLERNFGDLEKGFRDADYVREDIFKTQAVQHAALEPHAALAFWEPAGNLTLWASKQDLYFTQGDLSRTLGIPKSDIRIIKPYVGGGFGSKFELFDLDFSAAMLSKRSGRPVKICYNREEVFVASRTRHAATIQLKTGVKKDGTISALDAKVILDTGGYAALGPVTAFLGLLMLVTIYRIPNMRIESYSIYTNNPIAGAMRGHGAVQPIYALEAQLDYLARDMKIEAQEMRIKNSRKSGEVTPLNSVLSSCGMLESIEKACESSGWVKNKGKLPEGYGLGIGCSCFISGANIDPNLPFEATIKVHTDGSITLLTGASDIGQGSSTTLAQIAAEELGVGLEDIRVIATDSAVTPVEAGSYSSRVTVMSGNATKTAAIEVRRQLLEVAADMLEARVDDLELMGKRAFVKGSPGREVTYDDLVSYAYSKDRLPITGTGTFRPTDVGVGRPFIPGEGGDFTPSYSFGAAVTKVKVDMETGKVKVSETTHAHDCGFAINPMSVEGQLEGSGVSGQGFALYEKLYYDKGKLMNTSFLDYRLATSLDAPGPSDVRSIIVESLDPKGPYGAKEAGEGTIISPAPSIANAIFDATGLEIKELPITPDKVFLALEARRGGVR